MSRPRWFALTALPLWLGLGLSAAKAQVPQPVIPDLVQRSGMASRWVPIEPSLPPDKDRDQYYNTRWANSPEIKHINCIKTGGLYGMRWKTGCTACYNPYFQGSPGQNTLREDCAPKPRIGRFVGNFVHPWKPVGSYYAGGCYVPIYDLDPLVPGPGPFPWPYFFRKPLGG